MYSVALSGATEGIRGKVIRVETHIAATISMFTVVGLPDSVVRESRERVYAAIKTSGFRFPTWRITVNLAPAEMRKEGSALDLPIAVGILAAVGDVRSELLHRYLLMGELALNGRLGRVHGILPVALAAKEEGLRGIVVPRENAGEALVVDGLDVVPVESLSQAVEFLTGKFRPAPFPEQAVPAGSGDHVTTAPDFADVSGQEQAKRALEIAAAGGHNVLMVGPPGAGKTMLAVRLPGILPAMSREEAVETTMIHSVAGLLPPGLHLLSRRPFRAPHHSISAAALVGGGGIPRPGEISLAHHGVLFLDELPEFARNVLEVLRQPIESGTITVSRSKMSLEFPANFLLVCAMNPCACGNFTEPSKECTCTPSHIQKYLAKVSGPLLDRIDLHIEVPAVDYGALRGTHTGESSRRIHDRVVAAREVQRKRFDGMDGVFCNADMPSKKIRTFCRLDPAAEEILKTAITTLGFSVRAFNRILKVGRTIADLGGYDRIGAEHIGEAVQYRNLDRLFSARQPDPRTSARIGRGSKHPLPSPPAPAADDWVTGARPGPRPGS